MNRYLGCSTILALGTVVIDSVWAPCPFRMWSQTYEFS